MLLDGCCVFVSLLSLQFLGVSARNCAPLFISSVYSFSRSPLSLFVMFIDILWSSRLCVYFIFFISFEFFCWGTYKKRGDDSGSVAGKLARQWRWFLYFRVFTVLLVCACVVFASFFAAVMSLPCVWVRVLYAYAEALVTTPLLFVMEPCVCVCVRVFVHVGSSSQPDWKKVHDVRHRIPRIVSVVLGFHTQPRP